MALSLPGIFLTAFLVGFSGAMMPGPLLTVTVNECGRRGFMAGPLVVLGHAILEILLVAGLVLGLGTFLALDPVTGAIGIVGGVVLLWMGYGIVKSAYLGQVSLDVAVTGPATGIGPVWSSFITSLSNPYFILWWATVGAGYVAIARKLGAAGVGVFYVGHILSDLAWYSLIAVLATTGRRIVSDRVYRGVLGFLGVFLLGLAVYFISSGVGLLTRI